MEKYITHILWLGLLLAGNYYKEITTDTFVLGLILVTILFEVKKD
jgi:hypothetical protein